MREGNSGRKINTRLSTMDEQHIEKMIQYYALYVAARCGERWAYNMFSDSWSWDLEDLCQELRVEAWLARKDWNPKKGGPRSWRPFLKQRLQWRASMIIRKAARRLTVETAFRDHFSGDFTAPSQTLCGLAYELERKLESSEARKVLQALQTPVELIAPDYKGSCPSEKQVASYLGIAELSVQRGLREIKRHLRVLLNGKER